MTTDLQDTLLALNLALNRLENPLGEKEHRSLNDISEQLLYPEHWDIIKANLTKIIQENQKLNELYKESLALIEPYGGNFPPEMQQILDKIREEIPADRNEPKIYSHAKNKATSDNPEFNSDPISKDLTNWSVNTLGKSEERPHRESSWLNQLWQFLNRPI